MTESKIDAYMIIKIPLKEKRDMSGTIPQYIGEHVKWMEENISMGEFFRKAQKEGWIEVEKNEINNNS